ncbi:DUF2975 domain-containing protein [bacterium]|nr:DUF2975 domain-containing protein [bacterium]
MEANTYSPPYAKLLKAGMSLLWIVYFFSFFVGGFLTLDTVLGLGLFTFIPVSFYLEGDAVGKLFPVLSDQSTVLAVDMGSLKVDSAPIPLRWIAGISYFGFVFIWIYIIRLLHDILGSYLVDKPFDPMNSKRLLKLGAILLIGTTINDFVLGPLMIHQASKMIQVEGLQFHYLSNIGPNITEYLTGLFLLMLSQIFRRGAELQHDSDLTV